MSESSLSESSLPLHAIASPAEAVAAMVQRVGAVDTERVPLSHATGRVLAEPLLADRPSPAVDVSAMDGYAVRLAELKPGRHPVAAEVRIGREPPACRGGVVRIVTGGAVPPDADAVIKREDVRELEDGLEIDAAMLARVQPGAHIRRRGENVDAGDVVIGAGRAIAAPIAAALASFGVAEPLVRRRVRVGVLVTGDEVVAVGGAGASPTPWELRDSNGAALSSMLGSCTWVETVGPVHARDDLAALEREIESLLARCDALLMTGGVSVGDRDFAPAALRGAGARTLFHRLPQRPGKPVLGAITARGQPIFGLPGNPLSVMVTARRMAMPVLARLAGLAEPAAPALVQLEQDPGKRLELWWHRLVRCAGPGRAALVESMGSGDLASAARSDGFIEVPPGACGAGPWPFYAWSCS